MPIIGIDYDRCTNCTQCKNDCPTENFNIEENQEKTIFNNSGCILCGHCIAVCPEDAIIYENMKDEPFDFEKSKDPSEIISYKALHHFLRAKRSIRQYQKKKVSKELIDKVIDSMRYAPTGANMRNLKCLILSNDDKKKLLKDSIIDALEPGQSNSQLKRRRDKGRDPIFYNAPHVLIFYSKNPWDTRNVTIAMTYGMLSAQALGIGSCWIGYAHGVLLENSEIRRKFTGIETYVLGVMTLGYPAVKYYRAPPRPELDVRGTYD